MDQVCMFIVLSVWVHEWWTGHKLGHKLLHENTNIIYSAIPFMSVEH